MSSRSKKVSPIPKTSSGEQNITDLVRQSQSIFASSTSTIDQVRSQCEQLIDLLIVSSSSDPPNTPLRKCVVKAFSHLPEVHYGHVLDGCTQRLRTFFNRQGKEYRIQYISMLNHLIENFPFGLACVLQMKEMLCAQLISLGEELWIDVQSTDVPLHRFNLFQQVQLYWKIVVFLLPKAHDALERDGNIARLVHQMLNNETIVTLEIRLTCALVWHLFGDNQQMLPHEKLRLMKTLTPVVMSQLALYFGLIKTTMTSRALDTSFFVQLLDEILAYRTRDAAMMVGVAKAIETYSEALTSSWNDLEVTSLNNIIKQLLTFAWDHFGYNVETVRHCSTNVYSNTLKVAMNHSDLRQPTIDSQLSLLKQLPWQKDGCSLAYHTLLEYLLVGDILQWNPSLPQSCLLAMNDRGLASEASYLYCVLCHKHREETKDKEKWKQIWIKPVVEALDTSTATHRFLIAEYVLPKILKGQPEYLQDCKEIAVNPRTLIVCTRIGRSLGLCPTLFASHDSSLIGEDLIREGITSQDEQIRLDCLFILCENPKTTECITDIEVELIEYFLRMNVDNGSASFRNQCLALLKKHFIRMKDSWMLNARQRLKSNKNTEEKEFNAITQRYRIHLQWLIQWCCSQLYLEGSYCQRHLALLTLNWLIDLHGISGIHTACDQYKLYYFDELVDEKSMEFLFGCLWDTYEDIRHYALGILTRINPEKMPFLIKCHVSDGYDDLRIRALFDNALRLLSSTQPPETASGATLVQCIAQLNIPHLSRLIFNDNSDETNNVFVLIDHVTQQLDDEVALAKTNLLQAAAHGPMYGCLSGINALLALVDGDKYISVEQINRWRNLFAHLIEISLEIATITGPIVSSSSPEGIMPMELTDVADAEDEAGENNSEQVTSQMLLVCCWRTIKEISSLFSRLGQIGIKYIQNDDEYRFISLQQVHVICTYFMEQLLKSRHCGAYELAYAGFVIICEQLWKSSCPQLCSLPVEWIESGLKMVQENSLYRDKLCLTRRSGGLPFYLQSILTDEPVGQRAQQRTHVARLMETLLEIIQNDPDTLEGMENSRKIHAFNTLRSFYRNQRFSHDVLPYVERGLLVSICGFTSPVWMIRNCATLLLSAIVQRIFGPSRTKMSDADEPQPLSKKNSMTSREFFNKYPSLFPLFLDELQQATSGPSPVESLSSSRLFAILLILRRLYPSPLDGIDCSLTLDKLLPFVIKCQHSPLLRIREHSSKALLALISYDEYSTIIHQQVIELMRAGKEKIRQNTLHGAFLQLNTILQSMQSNQIEFRFGPSLNLTQMLSSLAWCIHDNPCSLTQCCYMEFLFYLHSQHSNSELNHCLSQHIHYLLSNAHKVTIAGDDLTRVLTRFILRLEFYEVQFKLFVFIEQTRTELSFIETLLREKDLRLFEKSIREWLIDLLLTMDLFNEQLFTKACELLVRMIDKNENYERLTRRIVELIEQLRRPMSIAASFNLVGALLPLCSSSSNGEEDLVILVYRRLSDFIDGDESDSMDDDCACAILHVLSKARQRLYDSSNVESVCRYWRLLLKLSSFQSDTVRQELTKAIPLIIDDRRLSGVFGANCYLTQDVLFDHFTRDALSFTSGSVFIDLIVELFIDFLSQIYSGDENDQEEINVDRRLWPSSEGYNNVFVSRLEDCDHYCACYGRHLLSTFEQIIDKFPPTNMDKTIQTIRDQCNRLIDIQRKAYEHFNITQRSHVRLKLLIEFLRLTKALDGVQVERLPRQWMIVNQDEKLPLF